MTMLVMIIQNLRSSRLLARSNFKLLIITSLDLILKGFLKCFYYPPWSCIPWHFKDLFKLNILSQMLHSTSVLCEYPNSKLNLILRSTIKQSINKMLSQKTFPHSLQLTSSGNWTQRWLQKPDPEEVKEIQPELINCSWYKVFIIT